MSGNITQDPQQQLMALTQFLKESSLFSLNNNIKKLLSISPLYTFGVTNYEAGPLVLAQVSALDKLRQQPTDKPLNLSVTATFPQPKNVGTIVKSTLLHEDKNITHWALSNGMDVLYQRNPAAKKTVYLRMNQRGGRSSLPYSLIPASHLTVDSFIRSGLASMNASELNGYLRRHNTNIMPFIAYAGHGVDITTDTKYLAESLLILHQVLTSATLDPQQFEAVKSERVTRQKSALSSDEGRDRKSVV